MSLRGTAAIGVDEIVQLTGTSRKVARAMFNDHGGPLRRIPHTGTRVLAPRGQTLRVLGIEDPNNHIAVYDSESLT